MAKKLSERHKKFIAEYLIDLNATQAAIRCGYSRKSAEVQGSRLLSNDKIWGAVQSAHHKRLEKLEITADRVLQEIAVCAYSNMDDFLSADGKDVFRLDLPKTSRQQRATIAELSEDTTGGSGDGERRLVLRTKVKLYNRLQALELLGRHLKMFTDKVEHSGLEGLAEKLADIRKRKNASIA